MYLEMLQHTCFFFFSSRRRHTRYWRDWSSDVCSSDLLEGVQRQAQVVDRAGRRGQVEDVVDRLVELQVLRHVVLEEREVPGPDVLDVLERSEERRVGKEGRSRWSPYPLKKKTDNMLEY